MPQLALTFDDGPSTWSGAVLDILAANSARATFFVIGSLVANGADVLRRLIADGHEIGNHTWSHPWLARDCDDRRVRAELEQANAAIADVLGHVPHWFRAPHFDVDDRVEAIASELGLRHLGADVTPLDWHSRVPAALVATLVMHHVNPGAIVVLHDGIPPSECREPRESRQETVDAVAAIVPRLSERGYQFVTASELCDP